MITKDMILGADVEIFLNVTLTKAGYKALRALAEECNMTPEELIKEALQSYAEEVKSAV